MFKLVLNSNSTGEPGQNFREDLNSSITEVLDYLGIHYTTISIDDAQGTSDEIFPIEIKFTQYLWRENPNLLDEHPKIIEYLKSNAKLVFWNIEEGYSAFNKEIYFDFRCRGLLRDNFLLVSNDCNIPKIIDNNEFPELTEKNNISLPYYEFLIQKIIKSRNDLGIYRPKERLFMFPNNKIRPFRQYLIHLLKKNKLIDEGFISARYILSRHESLEKNNKKLKKIFSEELVNEMQDTILEHFPIPENNFNPKYPLEIDPREFDDWGHRQIFLYLKKYYEKSYFSLICESIIDMRKDLNMASFSEKLFIPISCKKPFLYMSHQYNLKTLMKYGYKTFHPYINEEYDSAKTLQERAEKIVEELRRLSGLTNNQLEELDFKLRPICDHNLNILKYKPFREEFIDLLNKIKRY